MNKETLGRQIFDLSYITGQFKLRSGQIATEYFDKYLFEANPAVLKAVAEQLQPLLPTQFDALAGLEMGGIPIATMLSQLTYKPTRFVRKQAKEYGTCKLAEGGDIHGQHLVIIEDVITSGGAVLDAAKALRDRGAIVNHVVCVIDRESTGRQNLADIGLSMHALLTKSELERLGQN
ncbi:MAG TPA: orotate phosphoribosyltransferase [Anaerolineae bacterium]|nr:orotate phosphoribosyltransferase [Anaerolineae bacterium]